VPKGIVPWEGHCQTRIKITNYVSAQVQAGWQNADLLAGSSLVALFTDGRKLVVYLLVAYVMGL